MVNPFGDEADSLFAWKERYKQADYERNLLKQRASELKDELQLLKNEYNSLADQNQELDIDLSRVKQELRAIYNISKDKDKEINELARLVDQSSIDKIYVENERLRDQVEDLLGRQARGENLEEDETKEELSAGLMAAIIPVMMKYYDPENMRYDKAFVNLVEAVISEGGTIEKIIGNLIKHGGSGPVSKLVKLVDSVEEFPIALEILKEEKLIKEVQDTIYLININDAPALSDSWERLDPPEIFEMMKKVIKSESPKVVVESITKFRDALAEKQIPMTTMMFQIRKLSEGIEKDLISREDALKQVVEWEEKVL